MQEEDGEAWGTCSEVELSGMSDHQRDFLPNFWGRPHRIPAGQMVRTCTFDRWDHSITFASKAGRFPTGNGPAAVFCTSDCGFCAVK
jgi:hypothetical protein